MQHTAPRGGSAVIDLTDPTPRGGYLKPIYKAWPHTRKALDSLRVLAITPEHLTQVERAEQAFLEEDRAHVGGQRLVHDVRALFTRLAIARGIG